jgi:Tol biopolymer transport system component
MRDQRKTVFALDPASGAMRELFPRLDSIHHLHVSPDGRKMVFLREAPGKVAADLLVSDLGDPQGTVLASSSHPEGDLSTMYGQPLFSPDGSQILFLRQNWSQPDVLAASLWVVPSDGSGEPRLVTRAPIIQRPIWHPNGRFIAFRNMNPRERRFAVSVVSLETGAVHDVFTQSNLRDELRVNHWSPDGRWIGISEVTGSFEYWVVEDPLGEEVRR